MKKRNLETPQRIRSAATIVLVRDLEGEILVYLLRRSPESAFFPGNYVFPGGAVDRGDRDSGLWQDHVDMDEERISESLGGGLSAEDALAYGVAAIRETFEEAGVLLARRNGVSGSQYETVCDLRRGGDLPRGWLRERVLSEGWKLSFSDLARWSHWITPEAMPKRFDTRFFLAFMPPGQECVPDAKETVDGVWISPLKGLEENLKGTIPLSPPTLITLHELTGYQDLGTLRKEAETRAWGEPRLPVFVRLPKGGVIIEPWDPFYGESIEIATEALPDAVLPPGTPFSRIWLHRGIWHPIQT
ncbi:MAG: hypothetical protein JW821_07610 [Deltaproteobacteria bacterium]|nr:hypothetical protein [Deltaproteobacteria bacterium]